MYWNVQVNQLSSDLLIIGGGVTGLTTAWLAAEQGRRVILIDRQTAGQEASWAGAGMLPPGNLRRASSPESRLRAYSHSLWPDFADRLKTTTGMDNGYLRCGSLYACVTQDASSTQDPSVTQATETWLDHVAAFESEGLQVEHLSRTQCLEKVPALSERIERACFLPDFCQVRNPRHLKALRAACQKSGVVFSEHQTILQFQSSAGQIDSVSSADTRFKADTVCITAGSWSTELLKLVGFEIPVQPVRGQICQLRVSELPFHCVLEVGRRYLVPRPDGLILVGSTEEHVGFCKGNTATAIADLLKFAFDLVPSLAGADLAKTWSGLRPGSPDELPLIGNVPGYSNLFLAAGHFRSGLQMSPATASILVDLTAGRTPAISLDGLECDRWSPAGGRSSPKA